METVMEEVEYIPPDDSAWNCELDISQLCRICANPNEYLIPIFQDEGLEHDLINKINKHLPIKVTERDKLPTNLCYQCASTLIAWHDMVIGCLEADERLKALIHDENYVDDKQIVDDCSAQFINEVEINSGEIKSYVPQRAEATEAMDVQDVVHVIKQDPTSESIKVVEENTALEPEFTEEVSSDPRCNEKEEDNNDDDDYSQVNGKEKDEYELEDDFMSDFESDEEEFSTIFSCNICEASNMAIGEFIRHTKKHTKKERQIALEKLVDIRLSDHIAAKSAAAAYGFKLYPSLESSVPLYLCTVCGQGNLLLKNLQDHSNLHPHLTDSHYCNLCQEQFVDGSTLAVHFETHLDNNDLICQYCNRRFNIIDDLELHENTHYQAEYVCVECREKFKSKGLVLAHLKKFHSTCTYCHICDKKFSTEYLINNHFITHSTINVIKRIVKSFACDFCAKKYDSKISLQRHIIFLHNDRIPFVCEHCGFTVYHENSLKEHLEIEHSNNDTAMCSKCGLLFNRNSDLDSHMVLHEEETSYNCKLCGIHFKHVKKLKYHLASHGYINSSEFVFDSDEDVIGSKNVDSKHSSEKSSMFICNYCNQVFSTEETYHDHLKYHQYTCDLCEKLFENEMLLNIHLNNVHTSKFWKPDLRNGIFPFKCNSCNISFRLEFELEDHRKTHENAMYQCSVCCKQFTVDKELQSHLKIHQKSCDEDAYQSVETTELIISEEAIKMETDIYVE